MGSLRTLRQAGKESNSPTPNSIEARNKAKAQAYQQHLCRERDRWISNLYEAITKRNSCLFGSILTAAGASLVLCLGLIVDLTQYPWTTPIRSFLAIMGFAYVAYSIAKFVEWKDGVKFCRTNIDNVERDLDSVERNLGWDH